MKPHTNFRTVPVTERLPEVKGEYITSHKVTIQEFDPDYPQDIRYWERLIEWWAEEIPEQAEVKSDETLTERVDKAKEWLSNYGYGEGTDMAFHTVSALLVKFASQSPVSSDRDKLIKFFKTESELGFCSVKYYERIKWYFETYHNELFNNTNQTAAKDYRDGKIVKPKE